MLALTVDDAFAFFADEAAVCRSLRVLREVGLGYLRLGQPATELSGGEAQRIKLATELQRASRGDTLYVLDEPTTGLHPADVERLMKQLEGARRKRANTVIVVEHDMRVVAGSDWVIDVGPGAGDEGGQIVAQGVPAAIAADPAAEPRRISQPTCAPDNYAGFGSGCFSETPAAQSDASATFAAIVGSAVRCVRVDQRIGRRIALREFHRDVEFRSFSRLHACGDDRRRDTAEPDRRLGKRSSTTRRRTRSRAASCAASSAAVEGLAETSEIDSLGTGPVHVPSKRAFDSRQPAGRTAASTDF